MDERKRIDLGNDIGEEINIEDIELDLTLDDIDIDELNLSSEDISEENLEDILGSDSNKTKWDGKLYIDYLGLNPLTIIKEPSEVLLALIAENKDIQKMNYLIDNLEEFTEHASNLYNSIELEDSEVLTAESIMNTLYDRLETFKSYSMSDKIKISTINLEQLDSGEDYDILEKLSEEEIAGKMLNGVIRKVIPVEEINNLLEVLYDKIIYHSKIHHVLNDKNKLENINEYFNRYYSYTKEEISVLTKLGFPVVLLSLENIIKKPIKISNTQTTKLESLMNNIYLKSTIVELQTVAYKLNNNKVVVNYL